MSPGFRRLLATAIAMMPGASVRRLLYRRLPGYRIDPTATIGFGTIIAVRSFDCGPSVFIGKHNRFRGDLDLEIGAATRIIDRNRIVTNLNRANARTMARGYKGRVSIGRECLINAFHFIDGTGQFVMADKAWLAGMNSEVWTHGLQVVDHDVTIGASCYLGSSVRIAPGVTLPEGCIVSLGTVLLKSIPERNSIVLGNPGVPVKVLTAEERTGRYTADFAYW